MSFIKEDGMIKIDGDFLIIWEEYETPTTPVFINEFPVRIEVGIRNNGYDDTCFTIDEYI